MYNTDKMAIFIDGGYFGRILMDEYDLGLAQVDYSKLEDLISDGHSHLRTYYYDCLPLIEDGATESTKRALRDAENFHADLQKLDRFEVRLGTLKRKRTRHGDLTVEQKRVDVQLAVDIVRLSLKGFISHAAIITGDTDFIPAIRAAKDAGVIVRVYNAWKSNKPDELWQCADERYEVNNEFIESIKTA